MNLSHRHSALATAAQLSALPPPIPRGPIHQPVAHGRLVAMLKMTALTRGYHISREEFALARNGQRLFGVMDLVRPPAVAVSHEWLNDRGLSIGFRNSTDESLAITMVAGVKVFVCDNLALSGDMIALQRRNTTGLDLAAELTDGFDRFLTHADALNVRITQLQGKPVTDLQAKARIFDLFAERVLPMRLFTDVGRCYFHPTEATPDCQPRTEWGLHNAFTRALKKLAPARAFTANVALGQAFGLSRA